MFIDWLLNSQKKTWRMIKVLKRKELQKKIKQDRDKARMKYMLMAGR